MLEEDDYLQQMNQSQKFRVGRVHYGEGGELEPKLRLSSIRNSNRGNDLSEYDFRETLGVGGFGTVRRAVHRPTGEIVAAKICTVNQDERLLESIEKEIELQRKVLHSGIAQIYEVVRQEGKIYIFMEYCRNGELFQRINKDGPLQEKDAAKVFHRILGALIYLKSNGLSHRDIKPQNILFDEQWNAKLIDFGFGCDGGTRFRTTVCGTPSYTPPEIIRKQAYDPELVDVWSLGVTLYAMLAAQLPFQGEDFEQRKKNILSLRYRQQPSFSSKAQKLIASIFVDAKYRPRLFDLMNSEFMLAYDFRSADFIDLRHDTPETEDKIVQIIESNHRIEGKLLKQSVRNCQLDRYRAHYYLTLKRFKDGRLDPYKKKKRSSLIKLDSLTRTPSLSKNSNGSNRSSLNKEPLNTPQRKMKVNLPTPRLIIDTKRPRLKLNTPDSPRRLIDFLGQSNED